MAISKQYELALSMIVEEHEPLEIVRRAISSIKDYVDGMFITVTHKGEKPEDSPLLTYLSGIGAVVSFYKWNYRFDDARNFATQQIPLEYLYYIWIDSDDLVVGGELLSGIIKQMQLYNQAAIFLDYFYSVDLDEKGRVKEVVILHKRERLIRNDSTFKWMGRLHETLVDNKHHNITKIYNEGVKVVHLSSDDRSHNNLARNIEILEEAVKQEKRKDPRTLLYLGKAYFDRAREFQDKNKTIIDFKLAEMLFREYLQGSGTPGQDYQGGSGWREERATAWEYLGETFRWRKEFNKAIKATLNSILEAPEYPNYYIDMAVNYVMLHDFAKSQVWLDIAKHVEVPESTIVMMPRDMKTRALSVDYQIALSKNELDRAKESLEKLVQILPGNQLYIDVLERVDNARIINRVSQSIAYLGRYLEGTHEKEQILALIQAIPPELQEEKFVAQLRNKFLPSRIHNNDEIAIVCGPGAEPWTPKSLETGIGGSESAVILNAKELAKLGYRVTVYGSPQLDAGTYDGVRYVNWYEVNIKDTFNILILWRAIAFIDTKFFAKQTYLWAHDVPSNPDFTIERVKKVDNIFALSDYHKSLFKMMTDKGEFVDIPEGKMIITANGIPEYPVDPKIQRNPHKMIYASSYDRGLANLLLIWEKVKKEVPDAELNIFYGWDLFDKFFRDNPERMAWKTKMVEMMQQPGIVEHGRIPQKELVKEFQRSGIFAYPTDFQEISCQNAMLAQKYGAIPIVTDFAALRETVQYGKKLKDIDITSTEGKEKYAQELIEALKNTTWQEEERKRMLEGVKNSFRWEDIAKQWVELFNKHVRSQK